MKIGILTYYGVHSHGAVLQANALKTVLTNMGHEVSFLTFERNYDYISAEKASKYKIGLSSIPFYTKYLFEKGISNILYNLKKNKILNQYREKQFAMGPRYNEFDGDVVIVGSDEVFSIEIGLNPFMYGHGIKATKKISYAACFGPTTLEEVQEKNVQNLISSGLKQFDQLSARDMNTKKIVDDLTQKETTLVCDPVILYGYEKEMELFKPRESNYILVYSYDRNMNDTSEIEYIRKYAKDNNLKVISIGYPHAWCDKNINADPNELMGYIKNAEAVITDTFHGSVLSIICNKKFVVKLRGNQNKLAYLIKEYELDDQIIEDFSQFKSAIENEVDFDKVNKLVEIKRAESMRYLENALK